MLPRALLVSVVLVGLLGCTNAWSAQTTVTVRGHVAAMALAGDAVIVVRRPANGSVRVERLAPGAPAQLLLRLPGKRRAYEDDEDTIAALVEASPQALAIGVQRLGEFGATHVFVGPPSGPLREVAACEAGLLVPAVAVSGSRVGWSSGGCGQPAKKPVSASQATIVTGDVDPSVPLGLIPLDADVLPTAIRLDGQTGVAGLARPAFFSFFKSEVRRIGAGGLGEMVAREDGAMVVPVGVLANGDIVHARSLDDDGDDDGEDSAACTTSLFAVAPHSTQRRALSLGGCPIQNNLTFTAGDARVAGDGVYAIVWEKAQPRTRRDRSAPPPPTPRSLRRIGGDGSAEHVIVRGTYRPPRGFATGAAGRVAWWHESCTGGSEIVIDDGVAPARSAATPGCNLRVLTSRAHPRRGLITVRLRCPSGCAGRMSTRSREGRMFSFAPGTHRLRVRLTRRERRLTSLRLMFVVDAGPLRRKVIRLR